MKQLSLIDMMRRKRGAPPAAPGRIVVCAGSCEAEAFLLRQVARLVREAHEDPALVAQPIVVVVPSKALRAHVQHRIVEVCGGAVLGVMVVTVHAFACAVLDAAQQHGPRECDAMFSLAVRRGVRSAQQIQRLLGAYEQSSRYVVASAADLASARLTDVRVGEALDAVAATPRGELVAELVRITQAARSDLARVGVGRTGDTLMRAMDCLSRIASAPLGARHTFVHGFADATGQATALLAELVRRGATLLVQEPPAPCDVRERDGGSTFCRQFVRRIREHAAVQIDDRFAAVQPPELRAFDAVGADAEVHEAACRIGELQQAGVAPESIAVVARDLTRYAVPIRTAFLARGVPFSGPFGPTGLYPDQRRWDAAQALLRRGVEVPVDLWLDAVPVVREGPLQEPLGGSPERLRQLLRACAATRLSDVAALDPQQLPTNDSLSEVLRAPRLGEPVVESEEGWTEQNAAEVGPTDELWEGDGQCDAEEFAETNGDGRQAERLIARARELLPRFSQWPSDATAAEHAALVRELLCEGIGWPSDAAVCVSAVVPPDWVAALERSVEACPSGFIMTREEYLDLLVTFRPEPPPSGGAPGAGVQVLDVTQARGLTRSHLFLLGLNRGLFPRSVREDPLLCDATRQALQRVLPDLVQSSLGHEEERYLFAQLLSSAPNVTLCWQRADDLGRELSPSPLVQRLIARRQIDAVVHVPGRRIDQLKPPYLGTPGRPRSIEELLLHSALDGDASGFACWLEQQQQLWIGGHAHWGGARPAGADIANSMSQALACRQGRGCRPGLIGPPLDPRDPRRRPLYVTTLENYARCPWQTLLRRLLRVGPTPDPLASLPGIGPHLVGNAVHRALQWLVDEGGTPEGLPRPPQDRVLELTVEAARVTAEAAGLTLPGLQRALGDAALPAVVRALDLDWPHAFAQVTVVGSEIERSVTVRDRAGNERRVLFRADRLDRRRGIEVLTDYKTGAPLSRAKRAETRQEHLVASIRRGQRLQVAAYAAGASAGQRAEGRYLFVSPDLASEVAVATLAGDDPHWHEAMEAVMAQLLSGWDAGVFFPRLEDANGREPPWCGSCEVSEACVRGDSEARGGLRRLVEAAKKRATSGAALADWEERLLDVWYLDGRDALGDAG